jgi:hypothetical protein
LPLPCDDTDRQLFAVATEITLGDGALAVFWSDRWLHGTSPWEIAPALYSIATRKKQKVKEAMQNHKWILDLSRGLEPDMLPEFTRLALMLDDVNLEDVQDSIRWRFSSSGEYTASSVYLLQFEGSISSDLATTIWDGWALGKCHFFIWTAAMNKILMADALLRRG